MARAICDQLDAVLFDMDGLLLDTERVYFEGYRRARAVFGLGQDDPLYMQIMGWDTQSALALLQNQIGDRVSLDDFQNCWHDENIRMLFDEEITLKPYAKALVQRLISLELPYAIATNTDTALALRKLAHAGVSKLFPIVVGVDQVPNGKPAPDIYLRAAELVGAAPARCAVFEDSETGVRAALAAGMRVIQVPDLKAPDAEFRKNGHDVVDDLRIGAALLGLL